MNILDLSLGVPMDSKIAIRRYYPDVPPLLCQDTILNEHVLNVYVNDKLVSQLVCTPVHLVELVLGRLLTEGFITGTDDVSAINLVLGAERINIELSEERAAAFGIQSDTPSVLGKSSQFKGAARIGLNPVAPLPWSASQIFRAVEAFEQDTPIHKKTSCVHSCYLFENEAVKYCCEDIGRHNAFDKVVGCALCDGVDLRNTFVFTSGRVPYDMVTKAIRAGIPMLVSKATPTDLTVKMAQEYGLTLIGSAHRDSFSVYSGMPVAWV